MGFALRASLRLFHFATTDILSFVLRTRLRRLRFAPGKTFPAKWSPDFAFSRTRLSDNNSLLDLLDNHPRQGGQVDGDGVLLPHTGLRLRFEALVAVEATAAELLGV